MRTPLAFFLVAAASNAAADTLLGSWVCRSDLQNARSQVEVNIRIDLNFLPNGKMTETFRYHAVLTESDLDSTVLIKTEKEWSFVSGQLTTTVQKVLAANIKSGSDAAVPIPQDDLQDYVSNSAATNRIQFDGNNRFIVATTGPLFECNRENFMQVG